MGIVRSSAIVCMGVLIGLLAGCAPSLEEVRHGIWRKGTLFKGPPASVARLAARGPAHRALVLDALMECLLINLRNDYERSFYESSLLSPDARPVFPSNVSGVEPCAGPHRAAVRAAREARDFHADVAASELEREDLEQRIIAILQATHDMRGAHHAQLPLAILVLSPQLLAQAFEAGALVIPPPEPAVSELVNVVTYDQARASAWVRIRAALGQLKVEDQYVGELAGRGRALVEVLYAHGYPIGSRRDLLTIVESSFGQTAVGLLVPRLARWVADRPDEASATVTELLQLAVQRSDTLVVTALLGQSVKVPLTLDWVAAMSVHRDAKSANRAMAELLVAHGAATRVSCLRGGHLPIFEYMVLLGNQGGACTGGGSTLSEAITQGRLDLVTQLLDHGASADEPGLVAAATQTRNLEVLRLLLDRGAPIEPQSLTVAIHSGSIESAELLLDRGARPDAPLLAGLIACLAVLRDPTLDGNDAFRDIHASLLDESRHAPWPYGYATHFVSLARSENCGDHCLDRVRLERLTERLVAAAPPDVLDTRIPGARQESLLALAARGSLDRVVVALVAAKADVNAKNGFEALPLDEATPSTARILQKKHARRGDAVAIRANYEARAAAHAAELAADRARRDRRAQRRDDAEAEEQAILARERAEREARDAAARRAMPGATAGWGQPNDPGAAAGSGARTSAGCSPTRASELLSSGAKCASACAQEPACIKQCNAPYKAECVPPSNPGECKNCGTQR